MPGIGAEFESGARDDPAPQISFNPDMQGAIIDATQSEIYFGEELFQLIRIFGASKFHGAHAIHIR